MHSRYPIIAATIVAVAFAFGGSGAAAQGRGKGHTATAPVVRPAVQGQGHANAAAQGPKGHAPQGPKGAGAQGPKTGHPTAPPAPRGEGAKPTTPPGHVRHGETVTTPTTKTNTALANNTQLRTRLGALLPPGTDLNAAAAGFKNFGQFVAAVHVSNNLGIPFDQLKARMTGPNAVSLGQAIQQLKPGVRVDDEVRRAENEAREDVRTRDTNESRDGKTRRR